jgi:hypothetical protein
MDRDLVEYFEGANQIGQATVDPFTFAWSNVPAGTYTLSAKATDSKPRLFQLRTVAVNP